MMPLKGRCGVAVVGEPGGETVMLFTEVDCNARLTSGKKRIDPNSNAMDELSESGQRGCHES
jgi:hypothetical protein